MFLLTCIGQKGLEESKQCKSNALTLAAACKLCKQPDVFFPISLLCEWGKKQRKTTSQDITY